MPHQFVEHVLLIIHFHKNLNTSTQDQVHLFADCPFFKNCEFWRILLEIRSLSDLNQLFLVKATKEINLLKKGCYRFAL